MTEASGDRPPGMTLACRLPGTVPAPEPGRLARLPLPVRDRGDAGGVQSQAVRRQGPDPTVQFGMERNRRRALVAVLGSVTAIGLALVARAARPDLRAIEAPFLTENRAVMNAMMAGMDVEPSGDVDRDFATMMIAHHQGAIDMARAELRHGCNSQLRRIAQGIIVEQQGEIAAMRLALSQLVLPAAPAADAGPASPDPVGHVGAHPHR